jgi:fibronectin type 3 domain-containing protein
LAAVMAGCGSIGDVLPPTLDIPLPAADLRVRQRAARVLVDFTVPELTTEGLPLVLRRAELRAGPYTGEPFDAGAWAAGAVLLDTPGLKPGPAHFEYDSGPWTGQEVFFRVRLFGKKGRPSAWSNFASLRVVAPLAAPSGLTAEATAAGVRLSWAGPAEPTGLSYRILRAVGKGSAAEAGMATTREWLDADAQFGESYSYQVQAVLKSGESVAESDVSTPVSITPVDRFSPAPPEGLTAAAATASIELSWEQNSEPDLGGYFVYRAAGDGAWERAGGRLDGPSFSDRNVQPGTRYRYAVSAVDQLGNESPRSRPVEAMLP